MDTTSSPAKKRKKNVQVNQNVKPLAFFFNKQLAAQDKTESDEQLAQRLQLEFDREYNDAPSSPPHHPPSLSPPPASPVPETPSLKPTTAASDTYTSTIPLSDPPPIFDPSAYTTRLLELWTQASSPQHPQATYALLTHAFVVLSQTTSRILITNTLTNTLRLLILADPPSLLPAVFLATNAIAPPFEALELGLGGSAISTALVRSSMGSVSAATLKQLYSQAGDPGDVAAQVKRRAKGSMTLRAPKPLTISGVYTSLLEIAKTKGQGSRELKQRVVDRLLRDAANEDEAKYLVRTLAANLRVGAVKATMLTALARAFALTAPLDAGFETLDPAPLAKLSKESLTEVLTPPEELVKLCYAQHPSYATLVPGLLEVGVLDAQKLYALCGLSLHVPLRPMLGSITRDLSDMLARVRGRHWTAEYKYDGQRAQVHYSAGRVSLFSRHLEQMTGQYPDLVALVPEFKAPDVHDFILEGEVVAVDENGNVKPFQTLAGRARGQVEAASVKVHVCLFAFDLMYLNGENLLAHALRERRQLLKTKFTEIPARFTWVKSMDGSDEDVDAVHEFFKGAVNEKCEGIMVKLLDNPTDAAATPAQTNSKLGKKRKPPKEDDTTTLDPSRRKPLLATYEPDKRLLSWLKVKKDYHASADTLDLVPIAGWHGQGRKAKWWSPILLAVYDAQAGTLVAVTKCMSGFTDAFYAALRAKYAPGSEHDAATGRGKPADVEYASDAGHPDIWFAPHSREVWEIAFADVTQSPTYTAAIDHVGGERGLSLRFPRFLRRREDKAVEDASSGEFLADLYFKQLERGGTGKAEVADQGDDE